MTEDQVRGLVARDLAGEIDTDALDLVELAAAEAQSRAHALRMHAAMLREVSADTAAAAAAAADVLDRAAEELRAIGPG